MTVKLEFAYIPIILPNHDHVWPNHIQVTSSLHHQINQTFPLLVDKKIIVCIMFAGEQKGLGTRLLNTWKSSSYSDNFDGIPFTSLARGGIYVDTNLLFTAAQPSAEKGTCTNSVLIATHTSHLLSLR